ncbi:MAG: hypothetical protein AAFN10_00475 [Bacteroidota bacterium]
MRTLCVFLLISIGLIASLAGQSLQKPVKVLTLENAKRFKRIVFRPGDYIRFQTHDGRAQYNGQIESINDSSIVILKVVKMTNEGDATNNVFRDYVPIREIDMVYNPHKTVWQTFKNWYSGSAMISGGGLILITALNAWTSDLPPDPNSVLIATGILTSGFIVRYIGRDKYKLGDKWQLKTMEITE